MKIKDILTEDMSGKLYHVTFTENAREIGKSGINPLQGSNWMAGDSGERYNKDGGIFAFSNSLDAWNWGQKQSLEFKKPTSIVVFRDTGGWEEDPSGEYSMMRINGKALKRQERVDAFYILNIVPHESIQAPIPAGYEGYNDPAWKEYVDKSL